MNKKILFLLTLASISKFSFSALLSDESSRPAAPNNPLHAAVKDCLAKAEAALTKQKKRAAQIADDIKTQKNLISDYEVHITKLLQKKWTTAGIDTILEIDDKIANLKNSIADFEKDLELLKKRGKRELTPDNYCFNALH